jgi:hypothetical protein
MNICKPNLAYFTSILQKNWLKMIVKNLFVCILEKLLEKLIYWPEIIC